MYSQEGKSLNMFAASQITSFTEPVAKRSHFRAVFILMVAVRARLAAGLLCKLQSEADLGLLAYSLGEVVKKLRFAGMESAEIVFLI